MADVSILDIGPPRIDVNIPERAVQQTTDWLRLLHTTLVQAFNDSNSRIGTLEQGTFSELATPEGHDCVGDGEANDSAGFKNFVEYLHDTGDLGRLQGQYLIPDFQKFRVTNSISMFGQNDRAAIDGGQSGISLFDMVSGSLVFENLRTTNVALVNSFNTTEGQIDEVRIRKWRWTNANTLSFLIRINFDDIPFIVKRLIVQDVIGDGGLGGISVIAPVEVFSVTNYEVRGIRVPNTPEHFFANGIMQGSGYSDGLNIGDDDPNASKLCLFGHVSGVFVYDGLDERIPRPGTEAQAMDGIRIIAENAMLTNYTCRNFRSVSKNDNTGLYLKAQNYRAANVSVFDAGYHEASVVFKGARRDNGALAPGFNAHITNLQVLGSRDANGNPVFTGRGGVYFGPGDILLQGVHIEGIGGPTESPYAPGETHPGMGALLHCQATANQRLTIENLNVVDCVVGGTAAVRALGIEGFDNVHVANARFTRISNAGKFSNQDAGTFPTMRIIDVFGPTNPAAGTLDIELCHLGEVTIREIEANGATVVGIGTDTDTMTCAHLRIRDFVADDTVTVGVQAAGDNALGFLDWIGGDMREVATPYQEATAPTLKNIRGVAGVLDLDAVRASLSSLQSVAAAATENVEFVNGDADGWSDTNFEWTCPATGLYLIRARVQWDNGATYTPVTRIRYNNLTTTNSLDQANSPTDGASSRHEHHLFAIRQIEEGQKIFLDASHNSGTAKNIGSAGGGTINRLDILKID